MAPLSLPAWLPPLPWTDPPPPPLPPARSHPLSRQPTATATAMTPPSGPQIEASLSDRWYVLGVTGSGKTRFAKRLMRTLLALYPFANLYILDSKGGDDFAGWPGLIPDQEPPAPLYRQGGIQIWQPPDDDSADYATWLAGIKEARRPAILLIDELSSLGAHGSTSFPVQYARLLKQGRSLRICVVTLSQEAAYIPRQVSKQTTHLVYFRLSPDDRHGITQAARLLGMPDGSNPEPGARFGFFYRRLLPASGQAWEFSDLAEFFS